MIRMTLRMEDATLVVLAALLQRLTQPVPGWLPQLVDSLRDPQSRQQALCTNIDLERAPVGSRYANTP